MKTYKSRIQNKTSMAETTEQIIQYVPFTSFVNPSFWHALTKLKLDVDKLNENTKQIFGRYTYRNDIGPVFEIDGSSFNKIPDNENTYLNVTGTIMNKNTIEDFKDLNKTNLLNSIGEIISTSLKNMTWIQNPNILLSFFILSFADLKKYHYYYWFAFPTPKEPTVYLKEKSCLITESFNTDQLEVIANNHKELDESQKCFFIIKKGRDGVTVLRIADFDYGFNEIDMNHVYFAFSDPSDTDNPGWPLRIFIAALLQHYKELHNVDIKVAGIRCDKNGSIANSRIYIINTTQNSQTDTMAAWVGWERNNKGNFGPKLADMSASMDPARLAERSSDLNIRLMKWRLVPELNVDIMKSTKCLLMGAGTLGCHVARNLLAWGFRHITFIDNGKVSFSNPPRQVLYQYADCLHGGQMKADTAAVQLRNILPSVVTKGLAVHIPMPGHPIGESIRDETIKNIKTIIKEIEEHDVIFLLLDTREARWLPTLIAAHYGKIVVNAALGFDSYLVIRHGVGLSSTVGTDISSTHVPGDQLGCYFCNDVTAPGNSVKNRSLDQKCSVTRPGVAGIAAALAVEVLVSILQHHLGINAPAAYNSADEATSEGILGIIPHSIRGFLHSYQNVVPTCTKFKQCIACSDTVIGKYREEGIEFLFKVFNSGTYLEEVTGLAELQLSAEMREVLTLSDEDTE